MADETKPQTPPPSETKKAKKGLLIVSCSAEQGRRRAGFAFSREPIELVVDELTKAQIEAIESDPLLTLRRTG